MRFIAVVLMMMLSFGVAATRQTTGRNAFDENFNLDVAIGNEKRIVPSFILGLSQPQTNGDGFRTIWDNDFNVTPLDTPEELFANSTSTSDTAIVIAVVGLDENYEDTIVIATLNGQTPVSLGTIGHVQFVSIATASSEPLGDVYVARSSTLVAGVPLDADVLSRIPQGDNITHNGWLRIPVDKFGVIMSLRTSTSDPKGATIQVRRQLFGSSFFAQAQTLFIAQGLQELSFPAPQGTITINGVVTPIFNEKIYIEFRAEVNTAGLTNRVHIAEDMFLIDKDYVGLQ